MSYTALPISGIYCLYFEQDNSQVYIGKAININKRYVRHCSELANNSHHNYKLLDKYAEYGIPKVIVLELCTELELLNNKEIAWIQEFDSFNSGFNLTIGGDGGSYGAYHHNAVYCKEQYQTILFELANSTDNLREISIRLNLDYNIINNIATGLSHSYLSNEYPELYSKMISKLGTRKVGGTFSKEVGLYKEVLFQLANTKLPMKIIADNLNISLAIVMDINKGQSHKYLKELYPEEYCKIEFKRNNTFRSSRLYPNIRSPDGMIYEVFNANTFAKEHNLDSGNLSKLFNSKKSSYKGWKLA